MKTHQVEEASKRPLCRYAPRIEAEYSQDQLCDVGGLDAGGMGGPDAKSLLHAVRPGRIEESETSCRQE